MDLCSGRFLVGLLLAAVIPCIGMVIVCKRLSMIGDALSHTSLAGVAAGLILGMNPVAAAALACITASPWNRDYPQKAAAVFRDVDCHSHVGRSGSGRRPVGFCKKCGKL